MNKTIAVIFGGRSTEHDVSVVTAISTIIKPLELSGGYTIIPVYITKTGEWFSEPELKDIALYSTGKIDSFLKSKKPIQLDLNEGLKIVAPGLRKKAVSVDIVFPSMHGTNGEDGTLMGVLQMANVPFVGCDMASSAAAMDKVTSKLLAEAHGLNITKMKFFTSNDFEANRESWLDSIDKALKYPLFVKPAHMGSSIGISKVDSKKDLENALEVAFHYDEKVLVEEGVADLLELTLPIMGNEAPYTPAMLEEPVLTEEGVFDFDKKYMNGGKKGKGGAKASGAEAGAQGYSHIPARIDDKLYKEAESVALKAFEAIGCQGIGRVDLLVDKKTKKVYFNEVNPLPGSLYAHNWRAAGISNVELVENLVDLALQRHAAKEKKSSTFDTNFLKQF